MWQRSYNFVYAALDNLYRMSCRACLAKLIKRNAARHSKCMRHALNFKEPFIIAEHNIDGIFEYFLYSHPSSWKPTRAKPSASLNNGL